jgi:hypothetical protein
MSALAPLLERERTHLGHRETDADDPRLTCRCATLAESPPKTVQTITEHSSLRVRMDRFGCYSARMITRAMDAIASKCYAPKPGGPKPDAAIHKLGDMIARHPSPDS